MDAVLPVPVSPSGINQATPLRTLSVCHRSLFVNIEKWRPRRDSNPRPALRKGAALSAELRGHPKGF